MSDKQKPTDNLIFFPNETLNSPFSQEDLADVFQTTLELAIYASMREKDYDRIVYYFDCLPPFEQNLLKHRNRECVAYHAEQILQSPQAQLVLAPLFASFLGQENQERTSETTTFETEAPPTDPLDTDTDPMLEIETFIASYQQTLRQKINLESLLQEATAIKPARQLKAIYLQTSYFDELCIQADELIRVRLKGETEHAKTQLSFGELVLKGNAKVVEQLNALQSLLDQPKQANPLAELGIIYRISLHYQNDQQQDYEIVEWPIGVFLNLAFHQIGQSDSQAFTLEFYPIQKLNSQQLFTLLSCELLKEVLELKLRETLTDYSQRKRWHVDELAFNQCIYRILHFIEKKALPVSALLQSYQLRLLAELKSTSLTHSWQLTDLKGNTYSLDRLKKAPNLLANCQFDFSACQKMYTMQPDQACNYCWHALCHLLLYAFN
ncbi:hypothetical protein [Enterococcus columbae]|uniref:Uncharacterized protein n=1 Tax=Enterococcus columbae DSM 7374 = ATCC 51263 TaxID=1121865 RepID=S0KMT7_9ENTE|nr:hypothetical protein [Enterococcus columbae]EOT40506.1 hypothetical protein OMW_01368 [Enterococcus columbae DSM 7374 = ATCC 51263]EOW80282.1 hypothetical protein I568_01982 [Enterococcus columbae DSM 7374 = ATCC 51263]OJG25559.1 hypothetical protein RR47_GL001608 [Enterococcus columbae DSM 7374 = ATCC 51263]